MDRKPCRIGSGLEPTHVIGVAIGQFVAFDQTHHVPRSAVHPDTPGKFGGVGGDRVLAADPEFALGVEGNTMNASVQIHDSRR